MLKGRQAGRREQKKSCVQTNHNTYSSPGRYAAISTRGAKPTEMPGVPVKSRHDKSLDLPFPHII